MKTLLSFLPFVLIAVPSLAQETELDVNGKGVVNYGTIRINNPAMLGAKPIVQFNYDEIGSTAFLDEKWNAAILHTPTYNILMPEVKLNFYTGEIWYKSQNNEVLAVSQGTVSKVIFFKGDDTTKEVAQYVYLPTVGAQSNHYFELLNEGETQLLKLNNVTLYERPYDPGIGKHLYSFVDHRDYYLLFNGNITKLRNLNKDAVFSIMHPSETETEWLDQSNNKLKTEKDFALFFNYYDQQHAGTSKQ